jgi:hypothetical protein
MKVLRSLLLSCAIIAGVAGSVAPATAGTQVTVTIPTIIWVPVLISVSPPIWISIPIVVD